ncbi:hypothetical protein J5A54_09950 [Prevotella melaninogenica]|nr:hypothetical protein J5A54_09950 [Prevotella melaninogenica]
MYERINRKLGLHLSPQEIERLTSLDITTDKV